MSREFVVLIEKDEEGWLVASCPALRGCHTQAKDMTELIARIREAIRLCVKVEGKVSRPLKFVGIQEVEVVV